MVSTTAVCVLVMTSGGLSLDARPARATYDQRMTAGDERDQVGTDRRYRRLPEPVRLDETIASVDSRPVLDADSARNVDQDRAIRAGG